MTTDAERAAAPLAIAARPYSGDAYRSSAETPDGDGVVAAQASAEFLGRTSELEVLHAYLQSAILGLGGVVLIGGEPGIGKTRLAEQVAGRASAAGARALWGRCWDGEGAPAFWPWIQVLRGWQRKASGGPETALQFPEIGQVLRELDAHLPDVSFLDSDQSRFWLFDVVHTLLRRFATEQPLLVILDDLHWADPGSILLLKFAASDANALPLLIVGTYRDVALSVDSPLAQALASVSRHRWTRRLSLYGLSNDEIAQFITSATGTKPTDRVVDLFKERTGGNPFFLTETVRLVAEETGKHPGRHPAAFRRMPDTVREAVERRLNGLPRRSIQVLQIASVIGQEFDVDLLGMQAKQSVEEISEALDTAARAKLLTALPESAGRYRFAHALVRDCLYDQVPTGHREYWHAQFGAVLERRHGADGGPPVAAIAHHYAMARSAGDPDKAFTYSVRAAESAAGAFGYEDAVSHYSRALDCPMAGRISATDRCELLLALGEMLKRSGNGEQSRHTFRQAACLARRIDAPMLLTRAAIGFRAFIGRAPVDGEAVDLLQEALSAVGEDNSQAKVELLAALTFALHCDPDPARTIDLSAQAMTIARRIGDPLLLGDALEARVDAVVGRSDPREVEKLASETVHLAEGCGDQTRVFRGRMLRYHALSQMGCRNAAEIEYRDCARLATVLRYPRYRYQIAVVEAGRAVTNGQFAVAERLIEEAQRVGQDFDGPTADQYFVIQNTFLAYLRGEMGAAESRLRKVVEAYPDIGLCHAALANACAASGHDDEARTNLEWFDWSELQGIPGTLALITLAWAAEAASDVRDEIRSHVFYRLLEPHARENVLVGWRAGQLGSVAHYLALLAASFEEFDRSVLHFEDALAMNRQMRTPALTACTERRYAEVLLKRNRTGDRESARERLERAIQTFDTLQMRGHLEASRALLAQLVGGCEATADAAPSGSRDHRYQFRREADFWTIAFEGVVTRIRHTRGLAMLSLLLRQPRTEVHVFDLIGAIDRAPMVEATQRRRRYRGPQRNGLGALQGRIGPLLDGRARAEYRQRADELRSELAEAESFGDIGRTARLRAEYESLARELKRAYGRDGRLRDAAAVSEKARINVRNNLSTALRILKRSNEALWRHLDGALRTGTLCSYQPERQIPWEF